MGGGVLAAVPTFAPGVLDGLPSSKRGEILPYSSIASPQKMSGPPTPDEPTEPFGNGSSGGRPEVYNESSPLSNGDSATKNVSARVARTDKFEGTSETGI